jgi:hypothetical protein
MRSIRSLLARVEEVADILGFRDGGCQRTRRSGTPKLLHACAERRRCQGADDSMDGAAVSKKIADDMPGVDELLARAEEEFRLMGCVSKLSDVQQGVVRLIMFEELSGDDVARELGLRPDHVAHAVVPRKEGAVPLPDRLGLTRQPFSSADRASPLSDKIRDHRSRLSSSDVSSILVAIVHTCPDGSMTHPMRSPQN